MNSKESISDCLEHNCPVIEVDVNFTSDGVPVLTHWFAPDGEIMFIKTPALQEFLFAEYPGMQHPMTLDELMDSIKVYEGYVFIDVKMGEEQKVIEWFENHYSVEQKQKLIFQVHDTKMMKDLYEKKIFGYLHYNADIKSLERLLPEFQKYNIHTVSISDWDVVDETSLKKLKDSGLHCYVYTINHARRMNRVFECGADGIFTDCYDKLIGEIE